MTYYAPHARGCSVVGMMAAGLFAPLLTIDGVSLSHVTLVSNSSSAHPNRQPCVAYQDVRFATPPASLACVQFQNFYAARISVSQQTLDKPGQWQLIVPWFDTMADAHCEGDAQDWHTITRKDVSQGTWHVRAGVTWCVVSSVWSQVQAGRCRRPSVSLRSALSGLGSGTSPWRCSAQNRRLTTLLPLWLTVRSPKGALFRSGAPQVAQTT